MKKATTARKSTTAKRTRAPRDEVQSRNQATVDANPVRSAPIDFEPQGPLPDIQARSGYAQRWIRIRKGSDDDSHNIFSAARRGWTPRRPDTVPTQLQWLATQREGLGGVIGTHDMVLMERPNELNAQEADMKRRDRRDRERAVKNNLFSEFKNLGGTSSGMTAPDVESSSRVERGVPAIQDD